MDWGDVPSWALVGVAAGALVLAALAARQSRKALLTAVGAAERADEARREAAKRQQADLVAAWPLSERETFQKAIARGVVGAAIRNASSMPIYNVELLFLDPGAAWQAVRRIHMVPPSDEPLIVAGFDEETTVGTPAPERVNKDGSVKLVPSAEMRVQIRFADAFGEGWQRDDNGVLVSAPAPRPTPDPEPVPAP